MDEIKQARINRNVKIIKHFLNLLGQGVKTREATRIVAEAKGVSKATVHCLYYNKEYPNGAEAWEIVNNKKAEKAEVDVIS